uniref:Latent-transforming growth factor beta-binding protein 1-like n=1 Tax=Cyprinodon variegatus TaxID=28743 RepID=A0A3Q2FTM8_CYPVA
GDLVFFFLPFFFFFPPSLFSLDPTRIQVMFTPTICKVLCNQDGCINRCEKGNMTTLYSTEGGLAERRLDSHGPGFRVFLCPLLCKNGGLCLQKDRCLCPANFTGKFCQIPVSHLAARSGDANESRAVPRSTGEAQVQHPPEASVKIHQVMKKSCYHSRVHVLMCVDVNECHQPGLCENGLCVNTMGSYSCVCRLGFILDATHGICISQSVISEEKGQCYRVVGAGLGPSSCSLPIARNITKQICCCSRVGKAWGPDCQRCPYFGSVTFKEICPAGPGYHYSASTLQFTQRADAEQAGRGSLPTSQDNTGPDSQLSSEVVEPLTLCRDPASRVHHLLPDPIHVDECQQNPCTNGRCENTAGSYRCACHRGYRLIGNTCEGKGCVSISKVTDDQFSSVLLDFTGTRSLQILQVCFLPACVSDEDECRQNPCSNGRCENIAGSYRCVCHRGYRLSGNTCEDVDECVDPLQCPGQECINTLGSYRCSSCHAGFGLLNGICTGNIRLLPTGSDWTGLGPVLLKWSDSLFCHLFADIDECRRSPCSNGRCENTPGSFRCVCLNGYRLKNNTCTDVDECAEPSQCPGQMCVNSVGSYRCVSCRQGYTAGACEAEQVCVNTVGSFRCDCRPGYRRFSLGGQCRDVNECLEGDFCFSRGECVNTPGSYTCVCSPGFTLNENRTAYEDECVSQPGVCGSARCENTKGSFMLDVAVELQPSSAPQLPVLPAARPGELRDCYYNLHEQGSCSRLTANISQQECCCTMGEGWGLGCQYLTCPPEDTPEFLSLCPSGRGYVTAGAFGYSDVDECKRFHPEVCKNGVCVNNIPGYRCYCSSGFIYNSALLECVDYDECEEETCVGGVCVNTVGSYHCSCAPPLVLDDTQRNCVNASHLTVDENLSVCWQHVSADMLCQSPLLGGQVTFSDCCCLYGEGWGMGCALCPRTDSDDYFTLCSSHSPGRFPGRGVNTFLVLCLWSLCLIFSGRYETHAGLNAEDCGILHGCDNGRCIRVAEGYTCDCYQGFELDMTSMTCVDINECEDSVGLQFPCVNARCVNTEGSFRCVCRRGYVMSRRRNHCIAA